MTRMHFDLSFRPRHPRAESRAVWLTGGWWQGRLPAAALILLVALPALHEALSLAGGQAAAGPLLLGQEQPRAARQLQRHPRQAQLLRQEQQTPADQTPSEAATEARQNGTLERLAQELQAKGIQPTLAGVRTYLQNIYPDDSSKQRAVSLIEQLGAENFALREQATQQLFQMPSLPLEVLRNAQSSPDPEVAWRAEALLQLGQLEFSETLYSVLRYIETAKLKGLTAEVLASLAMCSRPGDVRMARSALLATHETQDDELLLTALEASLLEKRRAAAYALARKAPEEYRPRLLQLLRDEGESARVRLEAAEGLANLGERGVLPMLINWLDHEDVSVRVQASVILRQFTGETLGYAAYDKADRRGESLTRWQQWLQEKGDSAELTFPLALARGQQSYLNGNTLLALGYANRVIELDPNGNEVFSVAAPGAWTAERLATGNTLVASYSSNKVLEFNPEGESVWEYNAPSVLAARPLSNGNVLISQHSQRKVIEVNRDKEIVWSYQASESCCDAIRLENGNTLVAAGNQVDEITPEGKSVWQWNGNQIYGINLVDNGNLLVSQLNGTVLEISRSTKETIWKYDCNNPVDAIRLPNGNTLVTANNQFLEVTPDHEIVWKHAGCNYGSARR